LQKLPTKIKMTATSTNSARSYVRPSPLDVLCGRGKSCYDHLGNQRFRQIIEQTLPKYAKATTKGEKTFFVRLVVNHISVQGGRFLKLDREKEQWYEGDAICAKSKVGHAFRDALADKFSAKNKVNLPEGVESLLLLQRAIETKEKQQKSDNNDTQNITKSQEPPVQDVEENHRERLKNLKLLKEAMDGKTFAMPLEDLPDVTDLESIKKAMMRTLLQRQKQSPSDDSATSDKNPVSPTSTVSSMPPSSPSTTNSTTSSLTPQSPSRTASSLSSTNSSSPSLSSPSAFGQLKKAMMRTLVLRQKALERPPTHTDILRRAIQAQTHAQKSPVQILHEAMRAQHSATAATGHIVGGRKRAAIPHEAMRTIQSHLVVQTPLKKRRASLESIADQWTKAAAASKNHIEPSKLFFL